MTHPLVEQVARAMCCDNTMPFDAMPITNQMAVIATARAAIAATLAGIREPSEAQCAALSGGMQYVSDACDAWQAMIDALAQEVAGDG